ncbi:hypothetical protein B0H14DRAFT_3716653 [Mycena olivaceomarginata]|nr:hypothetical protein B0H14DRAFT_3716653 [Mycena olivaceomarginata]
MYEPMPKCVFTPEKDSVSTGETQSSDREVRDLSEADVVRNHANRDNDFLGRSTVLEVFFANRDSDKGVQVVLGAAEEALLKLTCASCQKPLTNSPSASRPVDSTQTRALPRMGIIEKGDSEVHVISSLKGGVGSLLHVSAVMPLSTARTPSRPSIDITKLLSRPKLLPLLFQFIARSGRYRTVFGELPKVTADDVAGGD